MAFISTPSSTVIGETTNADATPAVGPAVVIPGIPNLRPTAYQQCIGCVKDFVNAIDEATLDKPDAKATYLFKYEGGNILALHVPARRGVPGTWVFEEILERDIVRISLR